MISGQFSHKPMNSRPELVSHFSHGLSQKFPFDHNFSLWQSKILHPNDAYNKYSLITLAFLEF